MENPHYPDGDISRYRLNIPVHLILTLLTCGIYDVYWNYLQMEACNRMLGREEFNFWHWAVFTTITCGLYHIYYQYQMGAAITEIQRRMNRPVFQNLPIISVFAALFGFSIVADLVHQHEINKLVSP